MLKLDKGSNTVCILILSSKKTKRNNKVTCSVNKHFGLWLHPRDTRERNSQSSETTDTRSWRMSQSLHWSEWEIFLARARRKNAVSPSWSCLRNCSYENDENEGDTGEQGCGITLRAHRWTVETLTANQNPSKLKGRSTSYTLIQHGGGQSRRQKRHIRDLGSPLVLVYTVYKIHLFL